VTERRRLTRWSRAPALVTLIACAPRFVAAQSNRVFDNAPVANWIAPPNVAGDSFVVFHGRRAFDLPSSPATFVVHVSADNRYRLYLNGALVSSGPQRSDVTHWKYETIDLGPQLHAGRNVLAAVVWNWGAARPVAQHSYRTGFLVQGDGEHEASLVNTGPGWKLLVDSAYAPVVITNATVGDYFAAAPGEAVDGNRYPWNWERVDYNDSRWLTVSASPSRAAPAAPLSAFNVPAGGAIVGRVRLHPGAGGGSGEVIGWQLEPRSIPPMDEDVQRLAAVRRAVGVNADTAFLRGAGDVRVPAHARATLLLDQSHTTNAYPLLVTSGGAGSTVTLTYAEALIDAQGRKGNRNDVADRTIRGVHDVFRPDGGGRRVFQPLYWRSFRYVQLDIETGDAPLTLHDFRGIFTGYPLRERARFASDEQWLGDVWRMDWNGARIGAFETYMDTPYYEQLQYVGDTRVQALISLYMSGDDRLVRQAIEQFDASRIPEGLTMSRYPSALPQIIPPFSLIYVAMVDDYHMLRDDPAFVRKRLAGIRGVLDWYAGHVDSTGMLGAMPYWNYVDWAREWDGGRPPGANAGHSATITLLYAYALQRAAALEADVGVAAIAAEYRRRADALIAAIRKLSWDETRGLFRDTPGLSAYSQQTNVLAVLTDAVPLAQQRAVMERVLADSTLTRSTYYFSFYLLEALRNAGLGDRYVEQLAPWREMLRLGLTSTPENPEPTRSDSHAWAAHPNYGLLATVLGVRPASAGFRTVQIAPALGVLRWAEGRVPHPAGDIDVRVTRRGERGADAVISLPPGLIGEFVWAGRHVPLHGGRQELTIEAPEPAASQNPSPMVEQTRAHERLTPQALAGGRRSFAGPDGKPVEVWIPDGVNPDDLSLVVHFLGAAWLPEFAASHLGKNTVAAVVNLGAGSGVYDRAFSEPAAFDSLLAGITRELSGSLGKEARVRRVTLVGFSAGHGAIRAILRERRHFARVDAVLLLDGMHTSYVPDGTVLEKGGTLDARNLEAFVRFAQAAVRGEKRFLITHSEIFPGTFASTTETADYLLRALGLRRTPVLRWGPHGMQQLGEVRSGGFELLSFAGNTAPDHVDHFHGMPEFLERISR